MSDGYALVGPVYPAVAIQIESGGNGVHETATVDILAAQNAAFVIPSDDMQLLVATLAFLFD